MREKFKGFILGSVMTSLVMGSIAYAASSSQIEVYFKDLKYMIEGVQKVPTEGNGFIYEGTTYVPLRFMGESLGKSVAWDGDTETIWVGKKDGNNIGLTSLKYARVDVSGYSDIRTDANNINTAIAGTAYTKGMMAKIVNTPGVDKASIDYNLNGKYKKLTALVGIDDEKKNAKTTSTITVLGDGKELKVIPKLRGGDNAIPVEIDVTNVLKLQIVFTADLTPTTNIGEFVSVDFVEPKLFE